MSFAFTVLIVLCAVEDSRTRTVSVFSLTALLAAAFIAGADQGVLRAFLSSGSVTVDRGVIQRILVIFVLATPFVLIALSEAGGSADILGAVATGLRFPGGEALAVVTVACVIGASSLVCKGGSRNVPLLRRRDEESLVPFFPCLAAASILIGGIS